ncbi:RGCVC family protein [Pseudonocardia charpentierae]|uniref:RGCVC family protein n=1 Tax=Pseudonocardia charpentierae TaxID=3075545 RepID=A0ABU2N4X0_9PSEU|nr:RGCVC family protein [Pseudonocardia sp. DSM 45834]MDT0348962.1 RGCVC family protein [Pseudonocardia sp. DSM 45834]
MMITNNAAPVMHAQTSDHEQVGAATCPACVHLVDSHDVIATRFCAATLARSMDRGCACLR